MPIGFTSSCTDTISPRSCTLDCTLVFVRGKQVWRMCVEHACVALACMQGMTRVHVKWNVKRKMVHFIFIAPMHSYVTNVLVYNLHMTIFSRVYSYVTCMLLVCTRALLVCYSYVFVCYSYVLVCTRRLLVCTRMLLVCYSCVVLVTIILFCRSCKFYSSIVNLSPARWMNQNLYIYTTTWEISAIWLAEIRCISA